MTPLSDAAARFCERLIAQRQADDRLPGLAAAVVRDGVRVWEAGIGLANLGDPAAAPTSDTQFLIGSITKTFTAVMVLQLRDAGTLGLDDLLSDHLSDQPRTGVTLRRLMSHTSGLRREPLGHVWESLEMPPVDDLLRNLDQVPGVLPAGRAFHYSNLAYALLGQVVARYCAGGWDTAVVDLLLRPLHMSRTTTAQVAPAATGMFVDPFSDHATAEPVPDYQALRPAAGLWSTTADLGRWAAFLAEPDPAVLSPDTLDEMSEVGVIRDGRHWNLGWGLGLQLDRRDCGVLVGHNGSMPGFLAGLAVHRPSKIGAVVLTNTTAGTDPQAIAGDLIEAILDLDPPLPKPWRPAPPPPAELDGVLGRWWSEGVEITIRYVAGRLEAKATGAPSDEPPATFTSVGTDQYRATSGRDRGELLQIVRDGSGAPTKLYLATYPYHRRPLAVRQLPR